MSNTQLPALEKRKTIHIKVFSSGNPKVEQRHYDSSYEVVLWNKAELEADFSVYDLISGLYN